MLKPSEKQFTKTVENIGTFTFRFPTLQDEIRADNIAAGLLGENKQPAIVAANTATMIGALSVAIVDKPKDFNLNEIYSYEELEAVYKAFIDTVYSFRSQSAFAKPTGIEKEGAVGG